MTTVSFVDVPGMRRWIAEQGAEQIIGDMVTALEGDFRRWPQFDKSPRHAVHTREGVMELMPTSDGDEYGFKYVNGHPKNPLRGFQTVTAFGVLAQVDNGYPTFIAEMTLLTALRTAATSAMAARWLARRDASTMAMIGTGSQAEFQALGFRAALGIDRLRIWDTDSAAMQKLVRNLEPLGFEVTVASSAADAVLGADVITTCTADKTNATVLRDADVAPGVHINAIGGDCPGKTELDQAILERASVFVEYPEQTRVEGEIQAFGPEFPVTELWTVVAGEALGRTSADEITVFDSVGFAIEDFTALRFVRDAVRGTSYEAALDLVAEPSDPKDLFAMVTPAQVREPVAAVH
ncbi:ornithine cyclodeaminase [Mumia sp. zg.B53]|uniref:ornithine cyclodeaminase n=1 Tax=unclassified Mumia TaxID=2621872 RepID=UPI001C6F24F8|nr:MULTISPECIES: ornithine cyclodeaminase [unclassified Mumia]MBW9210543.1 ornithine cyclodeaminase [Mumia sp. zg.B21]MBW9215155.1 ornithine cyclodeaminase [Mumia sp. zg.B53]MDD9349527.1 ornithine cyclodeaminase [Mumia sp.]